MTADIALVRAVLDYASSHYEDGGWDVIVECFGVAEIQEVLDEAKATSIDEALAAFEPLVGVWADRQADARNSAF